MNANGEGCSTMEPNQRVKSSCDQEAWTKARILTAMRMALALQPQRICGADNDAFQSGLQGIANGTAVEILHTLNITPTYENLRKVPIIYPPSGATLKSELI